MKREFMFGCMLGLVMSGMLATAFLGCTPAPTPPSPAELEFREHITKIEQQLTDANAKLDKLAKRRIIFPSLGDKPEMAAPDIRAAVGHSLMAAADLCGRDKVVGFFRDMVGEIVSKRLPVDLGGAVKAKCQADATEKINSLLTQ